jgi:hypothetical protein
MVDAAGIEPATPTMSRYGNIPGREDGVSQIKGLALQPGCKIPYV